MRGAPRASPLGSALGLVLAAALGLLSRRSSGGVAHGSPAKNQLDARRHSSSEWGAKVPLQPRRETDEPVFSSGEHTGVAPTISQNPRMRRRLLEAPLEVRSEEGPQSDSVRQQSSGRTAECAELFDFLRNRWKGNNNSAGALLQAPGDVPSAPGAVPRQGDRCWSRAEWTCFMLGPSKAPPTALLITHLRRYRRHWRRCHAKEPPAQVVQSLLAGAPTQCQYILWTPSIHRMGNQIMSLISAFLYALLTRRIFLVASSPAVDIARLFCEPFGDGGTPSWILPNATAIVSKYGKFLPMGAIQPTGQKPAKQWNALYWFKRPPPIVTSMYIYHRIHVGYLFCEDFHKWVARASMIMVESNVYWVPALYTVPSVRALLNQLIPSRKNFATLALLVLHPSNEVWQGVTSLLLKHPERTHYAGAPSHHKHRGHGKDAMHPRALTSMRVGIQFRTGGSFGIRTSEGVRFVMGCLAKMKDRFEGGPLWKQQPLSEAVPQAGQTADANATLTVPFVSTLDDGFKRNLRTHLEKENGTMVLLTRENQQQSQDISHNMRALQEMFVLALAPDFQILAPRSSFGYVALGYSSARASVLNSQECISAYEEPCFLLPPHWIQCHTVRQKQRLHRSLLRKLSDNQLQNCPDALWVYHKLKKKDRLFVGDFRHANPKGLVPVLT